MLKTNNFIYSLTLVLVIFLFSAKVITAGDLRVLHEKTFTTEIGKNLELNASLGDVYISTWDKAEVYLKISGNKKANDKMRFKFENNDDGVIISAKKSGFFNWFSWGGIYVKYEIKIPANYNTNVNTAGGDIKISSLKGVIKARTSGGDITIKNTTGVINSSTSGGDIKLGNNSGEIQVSTSGGDIDIKDFSGNIALSTSGGDIAIDGKDGKVKASTSGGDIYMNYAGINDGIQLSTTGGDITASLPQNFSAYLDLSTTGGDVECDLPVTSKGKFSSSRLKGDVNGGGNTIRCSTTGGDIKIVGR